MTTYIYSVTNIENGKLGYNVVKGVFFNVEDAKAAANLAMNKQAYTWGVKPSIFRKVDGHLVQVQVKKNNDYVKVYSIQKVETNA